MGNPFVHIELNTDDVAKARKFYGALFDWKLADMNMGPGAVYTMIDPGKGTGGGIQKKPMADGPNMWLSYVEVADLDKTIASARKLGASIYESRIEVPGMGVLGIFADPAGAVLGVWQPAKKAPPASKPATTKAAARKPAAKKAPAKKAPAKKAPARKAAGKGRKS